MFDKIKAFFTSPLFSVIVVLGVISYYVFRLKRTPTVEEVFVSSGLLIARLGALIEGAQKVVGPKPAPPAGG